MAWGFLGGAGMTAKIIFAPPGTFWLLGFGLIEFDHGLFSFPIVGITSCIFVK